MVHLASLGYSDKEVATALSISKFTVASHWHNILVKNGAANRTLVIARYSTDLARNEIDHGSISNLSVNAVIRPKRRKPNSRASAQNLEQAILDCSVQFAKGQIGYNEVFSRYLQESVLLTDSSCGFLSGVRQDQEGTNYICATAVFSPNVDAVESVVITGWNDVNPQPSDFGPKVNQVFSSQEIYISNTSGTDHEALRDLLRAQELENFIVIPITIRKVLVGLLCLANCSREFDQETAQFLRPMIASCATFIEGWMVEVDRIAIERRIADLAVLLKTVTDELQSAILYESPEGKVMYYNQSLLNILGLSGTKTDYVGRPTAELCSQSIAALPEPLSFSNCIKSVAEKGETSYGRFVSLNNRQLYQLDFVVAREGDTVKGNIWKFSALSDVQHQIAALKQLGAQARDGIILIDHEGYVQYWNAQTESIFGYKCAEAVGRPLVDLIIPERFQSAHVAGLARYRETRQPKIMGDPINLMGKRKSGDEVEIELMLSCVDPGEEPRYCALVRQHHR